MTRSSFRHVYGPVPSRRLGRSLGIDLVPFKTCTYDCIYCQLGRTTDKTIERKEWVSLEEVLDELKEILSSQPDFITLSGSGEPTLYSRIDELIDRIRQLTDIPVAVLTNGSLFWDENVREQLRYAHLVIPSLDAGDESMFETVNRPHPEISFSLMLEGLIAFRNEFYGDFWLEVMLLGGHTAVLAETQKIAQCVKKIKPDRVQLNTVTRPPAEDYATAVDSSTLNRLARLFDPPAEVIADFRGSRSERNFVATSQSVLRLLQHRPCSVDDIAGGLGIHRNETVKHLEELVRQGVVHYELFNGKLYYKYCGASGE